MAVPKEVVAIQREVFLIVYFFFKRTDKELFSRQTFQSNFEYFAIQDDRTKNKIKP